MRSQFSHPASPFVAAIILCVACLSSVKASEYLPVGLGVEWVMDVAFKAPDGRITKGTARRTMEEQVQKDGKTYFRSRSTMEGGGYAKQEYTKLIRKDESGFYSIYESAESQVEELEVKLPLEAGQSWKTTQGPMRLTHTVVGKETITVAGKVYKDAFHLQMKTEDGRYVEDFWEVPGLGNVKSEIKLGGGTITLTLREFKPAKDK